MLRCLNMPLHTICAHLNKCKRLLAWDIYIGHIICEILKTFIRTIVSYLFNRITHNPLIIQDSVCCDLTEHHHKSGSSGAFCKLYSSYDLVKVVSLQ